MNDNSNRICGTSFFLGSMLTTAFIITGVVFGHAGYAAYKEYVENQRNEMINLVRQETLATLQYHHLISDK